MKILYLDHADYEGGAEVSLRELVERLDRERFEPVVIAPGRAPYVYWLRSKDVSIREFEFRWKRYSNILILLADLVKLIKIIRSEQPDVLHTNTRVTNIIGGLIFKIKSLIPELREIKIINHVRDLDPLPGWKLHLIGACDRIIANSDQVKKFLVHDGVKANKIVVIYNGIDLDLFTPVSQKQDNKTRPILTFIGQIYPRKGLNYLIESLAREEVRDKFGDLELGVIGQDPDPGQTNLKEYQNLAGQLGLNDNIKWLGYVKRKDVAEILARTDVFVLPSLEEPFGRVLLEAMAMQLPVVATRVGGIPEIVVHEATGFLVPPQDPAGLAHRIAQLLDDPDLRAQFGQRGRKIVQERFTLKEHVGRVEEEYDRVRERL